MPGAPDFRLYHSNALDVLAGLLAEVLRTPASGAGLLEPDVVLIPQVAMRRWLQATLAARHGVAANIDFLTPGEFVARALDANLGKSEHDLDAATLHWRLYAAVTDPAFLAQSALAQLAAHVSGNDPLKAWSLAGELSTVFERYQAWRRDWLLRWDAGADADDPQAILWRRVSAGRTHRARRIQQYLDRFEPAAAPLPDGLPPRVCAFATLNVSPDVLRVLATQARAGTLHCFVPSPAKDWWGDLQRVRADAAQDDAHESRLLHAWGAAGVDFMRVIGEHELVQPSGDVRAPVNPRDGGDSLLRRLQSDIFQRLPDPPPAPTQSDARTRLPALRMDDPSLQVHACHTRLRELQVLHDQLRGLFDDDRFDPPLQPREVAVLAPDIDPYLPYLDAVFGGRGQGDAIPYALADASPLAGEPLADVFLRLLALPVSRFGLNETLDLLASPPLADAAGLDAAAFDRLHAWLTEAGARWGIDAAHRERSGAPRDDAYTWAFALDRLLLGHASGSDADIAGVAVLPLLEGSALDALDVLVRLLRVLARNAQALGEALPPAAWRERLLRLLDELGLDGANAKPQRAATQRALDRLRSAIDQFAKDASRAGFDAPLPAEAMRAHFAAVLGEADTRAPLLTGGVSIGRMVPMRLLPFRVICVLGLDDGEFPRRDPAAGLNRLTAELGTDARRAGDRSTRDDDRYLFLQLFCAAQDVFYASYRGADPRDGSAREPSVLLSDLLAAVDAQHVPDAEAGERLVVHHPLQPFAPAAFGSDDEPRRFSYRRQWHDAASHAAQRRSALPPWFGGDALASMDDTHDAAVSLDTLRRFLVAPADAFLQQRLGLRLAQVEDAGDDVEPLLAPGRGLARTELQQAVFDALLRGEDDAAMYAGLRARGLLPSGPLGHRTLAQVQGEVAPYAQAFTAWRGDAVPDAPRVEVDLDGTTLHGRIADVYPEGIARLRFDTLGGNAAIRAGLDWLLASAAGLALPLVQFHEEGEGEFGPHERPALDADTARNALRHLLALRTQGLSAPLPFAPYSGWEFFSASDMEKGLKEAAKKWRGSDRSWGEGTGDAIQLALRGRDPFTDEATRLRFVDLSMTIFGAVQHGTLHTGTDAEALRKIAAKLDGLRADDAEDAA